MKFCIFLPPQALENIKVPVIYYLAGLTCNEELAMIKSGVQNYASKKGIAIVTPDTRYHYQNYNLEYYLIDN